MSFISDYISFVNNTSYEDIPSEVISLAKKSLIDTLGVACNGTKSSFSKAIVQYVENRNSPPQVTAIGMGHKVSVSDAALINGFLGHVDDFDEVSLPGHTAVVVAPAAMALAEHYKISGKELLRAYCLSVELDFKLAKTIVNELIGAGWCDFSVLGTVSCAAVAAIIMRLDANAFANALAISASKSSGVMVNFGTSTKPYHVGMAASNGIESALLAAHGITGNPAAFEGGKGFFEAFAGRRIDPSEFDWSTWEILENGMVFKKHPCCAGALATIETFETMVKTYGLTKEMIKSINVALDPYCSACMAYAEPKNILEAKFSVSFPMVKLLSGGLRTSDWTNEEVTKPDTRNFYPKVTTRIPDEWKYKNVHENCPCIIKVELTDGKVLSKGGELYICTPESWKSMISDEELLSKFCNCMESMMDHGEAERLFHLIDGIESLKNAAVIMEQLDK